MSLGKIGKLTNVFNAFKQSPFSNKSDMISSLAAFGNINKAASYLNKVNSDGAISNTASKMLLYKAYAASGITKEEAGEALNNNLAGSSKFGLLGNIKNVGSGIAAVFKSIAPMMIPLIIGAAGIKAGKMLWDNVLTDNAAQKNLQESVQKYKTEKSDLDNLQSQKETNKQRVYELRAKSNRTAAEDNELNNLLNEDSILDAQIGLKKRTVTSAQKQQALDAKKALEKRTFQGELFGKSPYPVYQDTNIGYAQKLMSGLEDEKQARKDVLNNKEWSSERKEAELKAKDKTIVSYETELADVMSDISSNAQDLYDEDGNLIDKKNTQDLANNINDLFKAYSMLTNSSGYVSDKMDNIFALSKFSNLKDKLIEAGKSGGTDAIKDLISQTKDLDEAMSNAGIDADDLADGIMAIADPDAKNLEGIKDNLKDIFGKKYSFFKDKNDEDIEGFWDYLQDNNLNPEKMKWGKEDISDNWEDYLNSKRSTEIVDDTTFASRFKNSAEDTATDLDTITDNFQTDMSSIKSSMDSIKSGTFQNSDITDLIQQFPELATETDNLQQGLQNLAFDKASDAIGKIRDSVKDVTDPKQLAAADKYVQSIMDTMDLSGFDISNAKSTILGNLTKNLADKHMASVTTPNLVNQLMSEYGNDEVAVQAIMKLSLDPSMANADLDTWKSKIEDTKVQIQLDTSAKNLDSLSKELTRLQTDASDQQTRLNNKSAYNMKAKVAGYDNLQTFVCQNSIVDALAILNAAINTLRTVTITGISWNLDDTTLLLKLAKLTGIDDNGATTEQSVLTGTVHVPVVRQQEYKEFVGSEDEPGIWTDLVLTYDSIITQFKVTFINDDESNTILDIQYVDKGGNAVDPTTREVNPIPVPTKKSTIKLDFAPYEFSELSHSMTDDEWDRLVASGENPYKDVRPIKLMQKFIQKKGIDKVYACSKSPSSEIPGKKAFIKNNYDLPDDNIYFVANKNTKLIILEELQAKLHLKPSQIAIVEDTVKTLDYIRAHSDFVTVHVSSFME